MVQSSILLVALLGLQLFICATHINGRHIFAHMMPWFETPETNNGQWGIHWTMANRNPNNYVNGQRDIASYFHPQRGPYASSDPATIDWQLGLMRAAGFTGVLIDWPTTIQAFDYPKNRQNAEAIIAGVERAGLKFAIVYEDNNLNLAGIGDKVGQARADFQYLQNNYFNKPSYFNYNGGPLVLVFGPQALTDGNQWNQVFDVINPKPTFLTLWYQSQQGGNYVKGEFSWIYNDFLDGLRNWYNNVHKDVKVGGAYPGFRPFYRDGGWPGPDFQINYGPDTFRQTLQLAVQNTDIVQIATWNDYGEGTIIEPTVEYGTQFLEIVQQTYLLHMNQTGVAVHNRELYTPAVFEELGEIYDARKRSKYNAKIDESELVRKHFEILKKFD